MPTNQQRREAARRKLERQLARRQAQAQARRQRLIIAGVVAAVVVIAGVIWLIQGNSSSTNVADNSTTSGSTQATAPEEPTTRCTYPADGSNSTAQAPTNLNPADSGMVPATLKLNTGDVGLELNRELAPCGVNSLISLASQGYFDGTICHRLTTSPTLKVLQCGDPTGTGTGGPGYSFADEGLDLVGAGASGMTYPRGTLAMANSGANTNGSQFFLVYGDSPLQPNYTILGTITDEGLKVVDAIAAKGLTDPSAPDGSPKETVTVEGLEVPAGAVDETSPFDPAGSTEPEVSSSLEPETSGGDNTAATETSAENTESSTETSAETSTGASTESTTESSTGTDSKTSESTKSTKAGSETTSTETTSSATKK